MLIGITCDHEPYVDRRGCATSRFWSPAAYSNAVLAAGGQPVLLPHRDPFLAESLVADLSALVISGGFFDIPPSFYGEAPRAALGPLLEARSLFERAVCVAALECDLPVLGICGGMQLLNVVLGGSLYQDLTERDGTGAHVQPDPVQKASHEVRLIPDSRLADICGRENLDVNSTHHQLVRDLGASVRAVASAPDGVIEAIEVPDHGFVLGVQWHPEQLGPGPHLDIYRALVRAACG